MNEENIADVHAEVDGPGTLQNDHISCMEPICSHSKEFTRS